MLSRKEFQVAIGRSWIIPFRFGGCSCAREIINSETVALRPQTKWRLSAFKMVLPSSKMMVEDFFFYL